MYKVLKHLKFLLTSTNQHGVHSPFVFSYLTKCIYSKKVYPKSKIVDVLLKSISYFECKNLRIEDKGDIKAIVSQKFPDSKFEQFPLDLVFIDNLNAELFSEYLSEGGKMHNDAMLLINSIHKNKETERLWNKIRANEIVTVTIDMFYCGAVFFRKEQVKEHFKIRI